MYNTAERHRHLNHPVLGTFNCLRGLNLAAHTPWHLMSSFVVSSGCRYCVEVQTLSLCPCFYFEVHTSCSQVDAQQAHRQISPCKARRFRTRLFVTRGTAPSEHAGEHTGEHSYRAFESLKCGTACLRNTIHHRANHIRTSADYGESTSRVAWLLVARSHSRNDLSHSGKDWNMSNVVRSCASCCRTDRATSMYSCLFATVAAELIDSLAAQPLAMISSLCERLYSSLVP